ncbi:hypothetical protein G6F31_020498 [Rhizopus arrhizus]|nr:hypothetical protein G6F31_020498 [Rhizopus arrhizus]
MSRAIASSKRPAWMPTNSSLARTLKRRPSVVKLDSVAGASAWVACSTATRTCSRIANALGVGTNLRPASTKTGSPRVSRMRPSVRLMAGGLRFMRLAAPLTLPSSSSTSNASRRFRSGCSMVCLASAAKSRILPLYRAARA